MRALADVLVAWGWTISGSDVNLSPVRSLADAGVRLFEGHAAENLDADTQLVVKSDAVPADNPELRRAAELGIPTLSYFEMLGRLSDGRRTVAIAGTHGKSSTTAMTAHLLVHAGLDPTVFCGATPLGATSGGRAGAMRGGEGEKRRGGGLSILQHDCLPLSPSPPLPLLSLSHSHDSSLMLVEACEYRANFLHLQPTQAAVLGIEPDHFDCYDSLASLENAFRRFAERLPDDGFLLARADCESTRRITAGLKCRVETFGFAKGADWSAVGLESDAGRFRFQIERFGCPLCEVRLQAPGRHNVLNALAAAALAFENGISAAQISAGLADFRGLHRRLERLPDWRAKGDSPIFADTKIGTVPGVMVIDDYAHHPTEVAAALAAVRLIAPHSRVWCVFQPHQASRTARLLDELAESLQNADRVLVADIFRAREGYPQPREVTAVDLAWRAAALGVEVLPGHGVEEILEILRTQLAPGDVLVTLGAGDVEKYRNIE